MLISKTRWVLLFVWLVSPSVIADAGQLNLLRNGSFEMVPGSETGQGLMPSKWLIIEPSPDTYSNDGSYGLRPDDFGNFVGATAQRGIRWVAAWSAVPERFGQQLTRPLTPNATYTLSAFLRQATRPDLANPGTYEVSLADTPVVGSVLVLGRLAPPTNSSAAWTRARLTFVAPAGADTHPFLSFTPVAMNADTTAYPGLDSVVLRKRQE